ncbi:Nucleic acid-binding, OB-fold-like protein [Cordyceps fumosorosea ARSEF 2679]|uniref:Nucleic acid-binding, OB-fold-like protein n=1 Tax=Cordyceps fumosorosea (strain ARSEF 2679) TaxID=1081104 RepID=A0A162MY26_CORFA|nr:Nucleic acid-binding, OB-fold-like protein [Cordyceps fumosorosea ARSEF 2679]OAA72479.1 Nucleic acid-binding, OB-fold-like protein [Cordyceps fumosorosea ARSEF 2679]
MAEAPPSASASASNALDAQAPTPIAQLNPELPDRASRVIDGIVTITWPYSTVSRSAAFILAEHDFRLRHARGQLRLEFHGHVGQKLTDAGIGSGDSLRISLEGAEWETYKAQTRVPGKILEWQLNFTGRLLMRVQRADEQQTEMLDLHLPENENGDDAPLATLTPRGSSPAAHSALFATEVVATPGAHPADYNLPTKRLASHAFEPAEYTSPAFIKRARVSYGSLFEDGFDIFNEDVAKKQKKTKKTKHSRFSIGASGWKYSSRSPTPEPREPVTHDLESDSEEDNEPAAPVDTVAAPVDSPITRDEASQTQNASFATQVAEQAREVAASIPSSPTPVTFGKAQEKRNGALEASTLNAPSAAREETDWAFSQPDQPLLDGTSNICASAATITTTTSVRTGVFGSSFGNSGFSVEHTTTASTSSIPVFNDALAESIQSREAAEERAPGQPEPAFDVSADEADHGIVTPFDVVAVRGANQGAHSFTATGFSPPTSISNPFAVEPFPHATLLSQSRDQAEDDIYEAKPYPEIQVHEDIPQESCLHALDAPHSFNQASIDAPSQSAGIDEVVEDQDESTNYDIECGEPRLQQVLSEEGEGIEDGDEEEVEDEQEANDQDSNDYSEEESGLDKHYEEDDDERYYDEDGEDEDDNADGDDDEDEDEEADKPTPEVRQVSQDPVYISLLSDSEEEDEPAAEIPGAVPQATHPTRSAESSELGDDEDRHQTRLQEDDDSVSQQPAEEDNDSVSQHSAEESEGNEDAAQARVDDDNSEDDNSAQQQDEEPYEKSDELQAVVEKDDESTSQQSEEPDASESNTDEEAVQHCAVDQDDEDASAEEHFDDSSIVQPATNKQPVIAGDEGLGSTELRVSSAEPVDAAKLEQESVDEMDVDEDDEDVKLIPVAGPERPLEELGSVVPSPIALDEVTEDDDAMEEDHASEQALPDASDINKLGDVDEDVEVMDAPEAFEDEIKSQPDVDMEVREPDDIEILAQDSPDLMVEDIQPEKVEQEPELGPASETLDSSTKIIEVAEVVSERGVKEVPIQEAPAPIEDQSLPEEDDAKDDAKQIPAEAEAAASTHATGSLRKRQLPTPIETQIPVTEVADIEIIHTTQGEPLQDDEEVNEDDIAASQQIMGEFLQHASPNQLLPPPAPPLSAKVHRRKRSDTISETGRRTRSQTKQHADEHSALEESTSSPRSHRRSSRSIDKTNETTVVASIESNTSINNRGGDRAPLLHRSFRITRSRGTADLADPSVAIAKATRRGGSASSASPRSTEHTPSRPIMLRVTRSMENIAEAGLKEGLVIPETSVRSARFDSASSSGTRSPVGSMPQLPSTQTQLSPPKQQQEEPRMSPGIPSSPPPADTPGRTAGTALKLQLQRDLRTTLPEKLSLRALRNSLQQTADVIAVAAATPAPPSRPRNGPRDYMLELLLVDPSSAPSGVHVAHVFRPHQQSLPVVQRGDVVLLCGVTVVALRGRGFGVRTSDTSAWAVFDEQTRAAAATTTCNEDDEAAAAAALPQIKGPPLEVTPAEARYAMALSRWWSQMDEVIMRKTERATQKTLALS